MDIPTPFEIDLVRAVVGEQKCQHPKLWSQIPFLRIHSRKLRGVGGYVFFDLAADGLQFVDTDFIEGVMTANKMVATDVPRSGLGFAVDVFKGRIQSLEIFTYGDEQWDGVIGMYQITKIT